MKKFFTIMAILLAMGLTSGNVFGFNPVDHVAVSPHGQGQVVIWPVNLQFEGFQTKLEVINTSIEYSVVAKVIIRSGVFSKELIDFFIYLSPTDVWVGYLEYGPTGPRIYSSDGSCLNLNGDWASLDAPFVVDLDFAGALCPQDSQDVTYTTAIQSWAKKLGAPPVDKQDIKDAFDADVSPIETVDCLAAHYEIAVPGTGFWAANNALVLSNYDITEKLTLGAETRLGEKSRNSLIEVEAALAKNQIVTPYSNLDRQGEFVATLPFWTFPTKYTQTDSNCNVTDYLSPYFKKYADAYGCLTYAGTPFDLEELTPRPDNPIISPIPEDEKKKVCPEVAWGFYLEIASMYEEGWVDYYFDPSEVTGTMGDNVTDITYKNGVPLIPTILSLAIDGGGRMTLMSAAHKLATVEIPMEQGTFVFPEGLYQYVPSW